MNRQRLNNSTKTTTSFRLIQSLSEKVLVSLKILISLAQRNCMKNLTLLLFALLIMSCSSDSPDPEPDSDPETPAENPSGEDDNDSDPPEEPVDNGTIPFNISVVLREWQDNGDGTFSPEGDFYVQDFVQGQKVAGELFNVSQGAGLSADAQLYNNGKEDILIFFDWPEQKHFIYKLSDGTSVSGVFNELFPELDLCVVNSIQIGANDNTIFGFAEDLCNSPQSVRLFARDWITGEITEFDEIPSAFIGDSFHKPWVTEDYYIVQYDDVQPGYENISKDGVIIYDANSLDVIVFSENTLSSKDVIIDGDELFLATTPDQLEIIDLNSLNTDYSWTVGPISIGSRPPRNGSISSGKIAMLETTAISKPVYWDLSLNEIVSVNNDPYFAYFNRDIIDPTRLQLIPQEFKFQMETETFAIYYQVFDPVSDEFLAYKLVFMDFDGNVLFEHEFPDIPFVPVKILKR